MGSLWRRRSHLCAVLHVGGERNRVGMLNHGSISRADGEAQHGASCRQFLGRLGCEGPVRAAEMPGVEINWWSGLRCGRWGGAKTGGAKLGQATPGIGLSPRGVYAFSPQSLYSARATNLGELKGIEGRVG